MANETVLFFFSCLFGVGLGVLYDVFRVLRLILSPPRGLLFALDVLYALLCCVVLFFFFLIFNNGLPRVFLLLGSFLGAVIYRLTVSRLVLSLFGRAWRGVRRIISWLASKLPKNKYVNNQKNP